jgi:nitrogen fixation/metabolism regulation signal transduction histidine kinase
MNLPPVVRWATGIRWQWKVFIPIIAVLLLSIVAIASVLETLGIHKAQIILLASVSFAILLCFVLLSVLLVLVERPLEDLMDAIARVRRSDLSARVVFEKRRDDIGQLGRQFNEMVEQLERNRLDCCKASSTKACSTSSSEVPPSEKREWRQTACLRQFRIAPQPLSS